MNFADYATADAEALRDELAAIRAALGDAIREDVPDSVTTIEAVDTLAKHRNSMEDAYGKAVARIVKARDLHKGEGHICGGDWCDTLAALEHPGLTKYRTGE